MPDRIVTQISALPKPATFKETSRAIQRVAAYARVSTDHEDQETSLAAQTDYYRKKILEHPGWEFVEIYVDDGISGLSTKRREGFNRMVEDCLAGRIDLVLTKSISRFARNTVDTVTTIRKLKEKGVGVYFEKENIFSTDSKGEFLLTIMSSLAQEESRSISENVTWGQRKRMADGKVSLAYSRFLGYDKGADKYTMVINEEQAVTVRRIFRMFLQGYTPHKIAALLTEKGIPSPCGCDSWSGMTVRRMLSNEKYKGDALLQKQFTVDYLRKKMKKNEGELPQYYVEEDHEPIISPWLFDYVQERLNARFEIGNTRYSGVTLFSSKLLCGKCNSTYGPRPWHSTSYNNLVWQCHRRNVNAESSGIAFLVFLLHICGLAFPVDAEGRIGDAVVEGVSRELIVIQRVSELHIVGIASTDEHIRLGDSEGKRIDLLTVADDLRFGVQCLNPFFHAGEHLACAHSHVVHGLGRSFRVGEVRLHRQHIAHQINDVSACEVGSGFLVITLGKSLNEVLKYIAHVYGRYFVGTHVCVLFTEIADDLVKYSGVIHSVDLVTCQSKCSHS